MKYVFFDAPSGLSGDMILAALLDLGVDRSLFVRKMGGLRLPVDIDVRETRKGPLRALKAEVHIRRKKPVERNWADIEKIIRKSSFTETVKRNALAIFKNLFEAEAKVHGRPFHQAHLHEAGADDALIDIVGTCFLAEILGIGAFYCSPLNVGAGSVKTSHGILPVPAPAVAELLKNAPVYSSWVKEELVTPTGAAIISTLTRRFLAFPEASYEKIGCGAGSKEFEELPNILRAFYGDAGESSGGRKVYVIEATIDDSTPQILANCIDTALGLGALDAFLTPVVMKKNRLATQVTVLAEEDRRDLLIDSIFRETTSIGVRFYPVERKTLAREIRTASVAGEKVGLKISSLGGKVMNVQPEYSDCLNASDKLGLPLKDVMRKALKEFEINHDRVNTKKS